MPRPSPWPGAPPWDPPRFGSRETKTKARREAPGPHTRPARLPWGGGSKQPTVHQTCRASGPKPETSAPLVHCGGDAGWRLPSKKGGRGGGTTPTTGQKHGVGIRTADGTLCVCTSVHVRVWWPALPKVDGLKTSRNDSPQEKEEMVSSKSSGSFDQPARTGSAEPEAAPVPRQLPVNK